MPTEQLQLPMFEKRRPVAARLKLNGLSADAYSTHGLGSTVYVVVEAEITAVEHVIDKAGMLRVHRAKIVRHCPHDDEIARKLLDEYQDEMEERKRDAEDPLGVLDRQNDEP